MAGGKVTASTLREKSKDDLLKTLDEFKKELAQLRVGKVTGAPAVKLAKIKVFRKNIARTLTVYNSNLRDSLRKKYAGKKYRPLDIHQKKTRAIRQRLTKKQQHVKTSRVAKRLANFPQRKFALKA